MVKIDAIAARLTVALWERSTCFISTNRWKWMSTTGSGS